MRVQRTSKRFIVLVGVLLILTLACSREERYLGTYQSVPGTLPEFADLSLEFKKGGGGIRRINGKDHPFRWVVRGHRIRIHTESGGTIIAHAWKDRLLLKLPGPLFLHLKKIR